MSDARGQFTFYRSYWEALRELPKKDRLPILDALIAYALDGNTTLFLEKAVHTLALAAALSLGIVTVTSITKHLTAFLARRRNK